MGLDKEEGRVTQGLEASVMLKIRRKAIMVVGGWQLWTMWSQRTFDFMILEDWIIFAGKIFLWILKLLYSLFIVLYFSCKSPVDLCLFSYSVTDSVFKEKRVTAYPVFPVIWANVSESIRNELLGWRFMFLYSSSNLAEFCVVQASGVRKTTLA